MCSAIEVGSFLLESPDSFPFPTAVQPSSRPRAREPRPNGGISFALSYRRRRGNDDDDDDDDDEASKNH